MASLLLQLLGVAAALGVGYAMVRLTSAIGRGTEERPGDRPDPR